MVPHRLGHLFDHLELLTAHDFLRLLCDEVLELLRCPSVWLSGALVNRAVRNEEVPMPCIVSLERVAMDGASKRERGGVRTFHLPRHQQRVRVGTRHELLKVMGRQVASRCGVGVIVLRRNVYEVWFFHVQFPFGFRRRGEPFSPAHGGWLLPQLRKVP